MQAWNIAYFYVREEYEQERMKNKICKSQYQIICDLWNFDPLVFRRDYFTGNFYLLFH